MKVNGLQVRNFTVFEQADFEFASGINVFIGENGTGKSHLLKILYALLRGAKANPVAASTMSGHVEERLTKAFLCDLASLIRLGAEDDGCQLWLKTDEGHTRCSISDGLTLNEYAWRSEPRVFFHPAREVLAMYKGFVSLYDEYELPFDETYYDACIALGKPSHKASSANLLAAPLRDMLGGEVTLETDRFYVDFGGGKHEAHLVAEGLRKIATLVHLVGNGSIREGGILIWDEPEANMNPKMITKVAEALHQLAANGVQIFVATHDLLLSQELSLIAEYKREPVIDMRFFALFHDARLDPVEVETAPSLAGLHRRWSVTGNRDLGRLTFDHFIQVWLGSDAWI